MTLRKTWHPNAYLKEIRNVHGGLSARTKILVLLDRQAFNATHIAKESKLSYNVVMYHLRLLKSEGTIQRRGNRRYVWISTGFGQKRLN